MRKLVSEALSIAAVIALSGPIRVAASQRTDYNAAVGPADAPATILVYTDFASDDCARLQFMLKAVVDTYPQSVRVVIKQDPPSDDTLLWLAHEAVLAAGSQGKLWEMADLVFANQGRHARADLIAMAAQLQLDAKQFESDLDSGQFRTDIANDRAEAAKLKLGGAPAYFINGQRQSWPTTYSDLKSRVATVLVHKSPR